MSKSKSGYRRVKWLFGKEIEVPDEWIKTNLNAVCRSVRDGTHTPPRRISSGIPLLSAQNIMNNGINWKEHFSYISKYDFEQITKNNKISINDILITIVGTIGRVCVAQNNNEFTVQRSVAILKLRDSIVPQFLNYYMQSLWFIQIIQQKSSGVAQKGVYLNDLKQIKIFYPDSKIEQQKIASILSGVDALIELTQKTIEKTERLKKGLMQKLLTRGISHMEFKKVKWLFGKEIEIPEEWNIKKFKNMAKINPKKVNKEYPNQNILYVNIGSIDRFQIVDYDVFTLANRPSRAQRIIERNDVIVSTVRPYLKAFSKVKKDNPNMVCSTGFTVLRTKNKEDGELIFQFVQSKLFEMHMMREMEGLAYPAVTSKVVANSLIPYPIEKDEKQKIASNLSGIDVYIQKNQEYKKKIELLKKGLMQKLLTGQIRVRVDH